MTTTDLLKQDMFDMNVSKNVFFKNVPPLTTVPGRSPGHFPAIPSLTRANIDHPTAILADLRGQQNQTNWGQFLINYTVRGGVLDWGGGSM